MSSIEIKTFNECSPELIEDISELEKRVFPEPISKEEMSRTLQSKFNLITLMAYDGARPCAYKIGYEQSPKRFYSWIGGVHPDYRRQGLATSLIQRQVELVRQKEYEFLVTHTQNRFREMLILNLKNGFDVVGVKKNSDSDELTIILERSLV